MASALARDETPARAKPAPGWYAHPTMVGTRRYWDGGKWTDHVAPVETPVKESRPTGVLTIARGVALGLLMAIALATVWYQIQTSNDPLECSTRNAERALGQRSGPMEICPD